MNLKTISRNVGYALLVSALFMLLSVIVSVLYHDGALVALLISFIITFTIGIFPFIFVKKTAAITMKDGYMIIVLSWVLSFVVGMLPYALWGGPFSVQNAWFESVSGYTTTGATILDNIEVIPKSLLFWRSSTHFIGGLGVVVFLLLIIPNSSPVRLRLANMELSSLSKGGYNTRTNNVVFIFVYVYLGLALDVSLRCGQSCIQCQCHRRIQHPEPVYRRLWFPMDRRAYDALHAHLLTAFRIDILCHRAAFAPPVQQSCCEVLSRQPGVLHPVHGCYPEAVGL